MPYTSRLYESNDGNQNGRRNLRSVPEYKRSTRSNGNGTALGKPQRPAPPETTNAENFYYLKQMNAKTPMVVVLTDGEEVRGWIEWYDKTCLKVNRENGPNLLIQKHCIKYVFKQEELG
jgi:host factor-I protein